MTDDKGVGEGPYKVKKHKYWWCVDGLGEEDRLNQWAYKMGAEWWASQLNTAHAAGVKAERERNWKTVAKLCGVNPAERRPCIENVECKFWCPVCRCSNSIRGGLDGE